MMRKSIYYGRKNLKAIEAEKTRGQACGPNFPWMVTDKCCGWRETVDHGKVEKTDDDAPHPGRDYRGW